MSIARVAPQGISRLDLESERMGYTPARGVPGYAQGLGQAPGQMAMPPTPMPIGRPTAVVGGPAYFTPQGYQAPPQPTEAFMPTDRRPDPIGQQFMRQMESPMGQQFQRQYEATQIPIRQAQRERQEAELSRRDARFQELMDRIAELEGQLEKPKEDPVMTSMPGLGGSEFKIDLSKIPNFVDNMKNISGVPNFELPDEIDIDEILERQRDMRIPTMPMPNLPNPISITPRPQIPNIPNIPNIPTAPNIDFSGLTKLPTALSMPMIPSFRNINLR